MDKEIRISQALGLIDSTLGSVRGYTVGDYRRRMKLAAALLRDDESTAKELGAEDLKRQNVLDAPDHDKKFRVEAVRNALSEIATLYKFGGDSGTEEMFHLLDNAMVSTEGDIRQGHEDGLFTDCLTALASNFDEEYVLANGVTK